MSNETATILDTIYENADVDAGDDTAPLKVWLALIFCALVSFWAQATVTEERFVPALNVIATRFNIPDDVAGATLMAAGASSPELFSSLVALFVTHSALGLGTIVGSEIFNQLVICCGAVMAARNHRLKLDKAIVIREVGFYALSLILLMFAISDRHPSPNDDSGIDHIYISFFDALLLFMGYICYVLVCSYFDPIVAFFGKVFPSSEQTKVGDGGDDGGPSYGALASEDPGERTSKTQSSSINVPPIPFLRQVKHEPTENFHTPPSQQDMMKDAREGGSSMAGLYRSVSKERDRFHHGSTDTNDSARAADLVQNRQRVDSSDSHSFVGSVRSIVESIRNFSKHALSYGIFMVDTEKPSDMHELLDVESNEFEERLNCFLWQQSNFYSKAKVAINAWHLRWFTFTHDKLVSVPDRVEYSKHLLTYPKFNNVQVDERHLILKLQCDVPGKQRDYILMAPSKKIFDEVVSKCDEMMDIWTKEEEEDETAKSSKIEQVKIFEVTEHTSASGSSSVVEQQQQHHADDEPSLIEFPYGASVIGMIIHFILYPFKLALHLTVPDVRYPNPTLTSASLASAMCLIWLIIGSYAMVSSLESLADLLQIPDAIVGVTVSAAGTSLPNYVASQCAAKQGFGNMAVSNAFGSNTFNILVGLGLPWTLYTAFATRGEPYSGLRDDGITVSVLILGVVLLSFVGLILSSDFVLNRYHAMAFGVMYVGYIGYSIGQVYI